MDEARRETKERQGRADATPEGRADRGDWARVRRRLAILWESAAGFLADLAVSPPAASAYLALVLFALDLRGLARLSYFGQSSRQATRFAIEHLGWDMAHQQVRLLALQVGLALLSGLGVWLALGLRDLVRGVRPRSRAWRLLRGLAGAAALQSFLLALDMVHLPGLYTDAWYDRGGWRAGVQVFLTDVLGRAGVWAVGLALLGFFLLGPLVRGRVRRTWRARLSRWRTRISGLHWSRKRVVAAAAGSTALAVLVGAGAVTASRGPHVRNVGPNILILAADGLRVDRAFDSRLAPNLARLAARSVVFSRAYTSLARTFPSWVSLLTGRFPHSHGVRHMFPSRRTLGRIGPTLPRVLREQGWCTAVVSDYAGEIFTRAALGFGRVEAPGFDFARIIQQRGLRVHTTLLPYVTGSWGRRLVPLIDEFPDASDPFVLERRVERVLNRLAGCRRFALVVFFSVTHFPYSAPWPYYEKHTLPGYRGPYKYAKVRRLGEGKPGRRDIRQIRGLYDGTVSAFDAAAGRLLGHLEDLGLAGSTILVVTSDHGENLYEGSLGMGHGDHLRGEFALRIPLLLRIPGMAARRVEAVVRDVDLAPTLAHLVGVGLPEADGVDLRPLLEGKEVDLGLAAFSETGLWFTASGEGFASKDRMPYPEVLGGLLDVNPKAGYEIRVRSEYEDLVVAAKHRCIVEGRWKLVYEPLPTGVRLRLYDVEADPAGERDLAGSHREVVDRLWEKLKAWMLQDPRAIQVGEYVVPRPEARPPRGGDREP